MVMWCVCAWKNLFDMFCFDRQPDCIRACVFVFNTVYVHQCMHVCICMFFSLAGTMRQKTVWVCRVFTGNTETMKSDVFEEQWTVRGFKSYHSSNNFSFHSDIISRSSAGGHKLYAHTCTCLGIMLARIWQVLAHTMSTWLRALLFFSVFFTQSWPGDTTHRQWWVKYKT